MARGEAKAPKAPGVMRIWLAEKVSRAMNAKYKGLSSLTARQRALAKDAGCSLSTVQRVMEAKTGATLEKIENLADALRLPAHELLSPTRESERKPQQDLAPVEELAVEIFRGFYSHQQRDILKRFRALAKANDIIRKKLGDKPLRGVSDEAVERAFGKIPEPEQPKPRRGIKPPPRPAQENRGEPVDDE